MANRWNCDDFIEIAGKWNFKFDFRFAFVCVVKLEHILYIQDKAKKVVSLQSDFFFPWFTFFAKEKQYISFPFMRIHLSGACFYLILINFIH